MNYRTYLKLMRPHQYIKNNFIFLGLIFHHQWNLPIILQAIWAFITFSAAASSVYIFNDIMDIESDRAHPKKCHRPLASGAITLQQAYKLLWILLSFSFIPLVLTAQWSLLSIILIYLLMNIAYSKKLKHLVIIDVFTISIGFMLRILAGTLGLGIPPSEWLLFCGMMLTLFLGFSKRTSELMESDQQNHFRHRSRKVLDDYSHTLLTQLTSITAACTIISYGLYTITPSTIEMHKTRSLIYTLPFVVYGIFRYLYLTQKYAKGSDTAKDLLTDRYLMLACVSWLLCTMILLIL